MDETIKKLSEKLSQESVQRTKGTETRKGYDTTGYGYQSCVDRFNEVLGLAWNFSWEIIHEEMGNYKSGQPYHSITVSVSIGVQDSPVRKCVGGHTASNYADALKGAITNGFKKTAAFWGVGRDAFAGTIDDDNQPLPESDSEKAQTQHEKKPPVKDRKEAAKEAYDKFYNSLDDNYKFELKDMSEEDRFKLFVKAEWDVVKLDIELVKLAEEKALKKDL